MPSISEILSGHGWRVVFGAPCLAMGWFFAGSSEEGEFDLLLGFLCAGPFLLGGALIMAPLIVEFISEPFRSLFYPEDRARGPVPMYGIPQTQRAKGEYEESMIGFEQIAENYPDEVQPYTEMIDMAILDLRDAARAEQVLHRGLARLAKQEDRAVLIKMYDATVSRLDFDPEWLKDEQARSLTAPNLKQAGPAVEPDGKDRRRFHAGGERRESDYVDTRRKITYPGKDSERSE